VQASASARALWWFTRVTPSSAQQVSRDARCQTPAPGVAGAISVEIRRDAAEFGEARGKAVHVKPRVMCHKGFALDKMPPARITFRKGRRVCRVFRRNSVNVLRLVLADKVGRRPDEA